MVKIFKYSYWILTVFIALALILASILSPDLLSSLGYKIIYAFYALFTLLSLFFMPGKLNKMLHLSLALLILTAITVKAINDRDHITLAKGGDYLLNTDHEDIKLELLDFTILREEGSATAVHYESKVFVDGVDTVSIRVNHPYKGKGFRLYQSSYRTVTPFNFYSQDSLTLFEGQIAQLNNIPFQFLEYDPVLHRTVVRYNDVLFYLPVGKEIEFLDTRIKVLPGISDMATVLEYVEVKGHIALLLISIAYILLLIFTRMRKK
jgi:ResB-like family